MRRIARNLLERAAKKSKALGRKIYQTPHARQVAAWHAARGDETLRLDYDLDAHSVVIDLGGYRGQWASDLFSRYCCAIHVFEPVAAYAEQIAARFEANPQIRVYPFALAAENGRLRIALSKDASSIYGEGGETEEITLVQAAEFLRAEQFEEIDLMKMNIEGAEYDLLDHLIESGWLSRIRNLQVQFHEFVPNAEDRMEKIQSHLRVTHQLTYQYRFVWENWRRIDPAAALSRE